MPPPDALPGAPTVYGRETACASSRGAGRTHSSLRALTGILKRIRFSAAILAVLTVVGLTVATVARTDFHQVPNTVGFDLEALKAGRLYLLFPGALVQDKPWFPWKILLLIAVFVPPLELIAGARRTAVTFFVSDWLGTLLALPVLASASALGSARAAVYLHTPDVGSSSAAFGCIAAFAAGLPNSARILVISSLVAYLLPSLFLVKHVYTVEHLISVFVGFALGLFWARSPPAKAESIVCP